MVQDLRGMHLPRRQEGIAFTRKGSIAEGSALGTPHCVAGVLASPGGMSDAPPETPSPRAQQGAPSPLVLEDAAVADEASTGATAADGAASTGAADADGATKARGF